ncbi:Abi family protein [Lactobacillus sp. ESL0236]|uniref:Abi family protein n=1 Tax=unclassified Lactobacillus TaxID=2620435 RepID=UPI000EFA6F7E|nr:MULTISPECIES: Abi family protein [unclassified Lactobacillus]RMC39083.1 Abi family protein [Lactobacillus sp. ESL0237]RMC43366.1 Abi family protein [Lactobacillus sp. ESL0234]RMC44278.1 Abi family protein [Lactobacillus sp. ESL0236]
MKKKVKFKTYPELLNNLNNHGLNVSGEEISIEILKTRGYYNLVNRYKNDLYRKNINEFNTRTTIENLYHFHRMEDDLRNILFRFTLTFEQFLKESMSYTLASTWGVDPKKYLNPNNYSYRHQKRAISILNMILEIQNTSKNPTKYYKDNYDVIPPWILLNNAMFGQTKALFKILPIDLKRYIIHQMMPFDFFNYHFDKYHSKQISEEMTNRLFDEGDLIARSLAKTTHKEIDIEEWLDYIDPFVYKDFKGTPYLNKVSKQIDDERIEAFSGVLDAIHEFRNTLAHGSRIVHFHFKKNLRLNLITKYTGANFNVTQFKKENLGNGVFGVLLGLLITLDKFDTLLLISKLKSWKKDVTKTFNDKKDYDLFIKSCGLPKNFIYILDNIRKDLYSTNKRYYESKY